MAIVRCPICKKDKRSYAKNFYCCGEAHNLEANKVFKPVVDNSKSSIAKSEEPKIEVEETTSEKSKSVSSALPVQKEETNLEIEDKEITEDEAKEKYECYHEDCGAYFNKDEIVNGQCPNCKEEIYSQ